MKIQQRIVQAINGHLNNALFSIERPQVSSRGKVRDMFDLGTTLVMVNTDRVSAFDQVLGSIPLKGALLCEQSEYWFNFSRDICPNHLLDRPDSQILVCKKAQALPVEVIVRGYLAGSLMRENKHSRGSAYGLTLDPDLVDYQQFDQPIITPTTKAAVFEHDEPISTQEIIGRGLVEKNIWQEIENYALQLFQACATKARENGLLLVDTKYEFGLIDGKVHVIDELHTSDSSRFFMASDYEEKFRTGEAPTMLDKEFLRQYLIKAGIDPKTVHAIDIKLDDTIRAEVAARYFTLTEKITGREFIPPTETANTRVHRVLAQLIC